MQHDVFGDISYNKDDHEWTGLVGMRALAQYGKNLPKDYCFVAEPNPEFHRGLFPFKIQDATGDGASFAQANAFRFLLENENDVCRAVMLEILKAYPEICHGSMDWLVTWLRNYRQSRVLGWVARLLRPECKTIEDLKEAVRCNGLEFSVVHLNTFAYVAFYFDTIWYETHDQGFSVVFHPNRGTWCGDGCALGDIIEADNMDAIDTI
jgi:hypothetical protein